jgi:hypothetical protein
MLRICAKDLSSRASRARGSGGTPTLEEPPPSICPLRPLPPPARRWRPRPAGKGRRVVWACPDGPPSRGGAASPGRRVESEMLASICGEARRRGCSRACCSGDGRVVVRQRGRGRRRGSKAQAAAAWSAARGASGAAAGRPWVADACRRHPDSTGQVRVAEVQGPIWVLLGPIWVPRAQSVQGSQPEWPDVFAIGWAVYLGMLSGRAGPAKSPTPKSATQARPGCRASFFCPSLARRAKNSVGPGLH